MSISVVNACAATKQASGEWQSIKDVHIGIFFEGSGLNMVREYVSSELFTKDKSDYAEQVKKYDSDQSELKGEKKQLEGLLAITTGKDDSAAIKKRQKEVDASLQEVRSSLQESNIHPYITPEQLCKIEQEKGRKVAFTNISLLYSLFTGSNIQSPYVRKFYIEGCGTKDISASTEIMNVQGWRISGDRCDIGDVFDDGVGFATGQGKTGVISLVSKAVNHVTQYVNSLGGKPSDTTLHFYIFGFSRGATCARLFCNLLTRGKKEKITHEKEFKTYITQKNLYNTATGRLDFLDKYVTNGKVTVEFLGLFDTVASIGIYGSEVVLNNTTQVWHCNNYKEFGLGISPKVKNGIHICAKDEFRKNFALVGAYGYLPEVFVPGCHTDIGGGCSMDSEESVYLYKTKWDIRYDEFVNYTIPNESTISKGSDLNLSTLQEMGWLEDKVGEYTKKMEEDNDKLEMVRKVRRGYSDIPLAMMKECFQSKCGMLFNQIPDEHNYKKNSDSYLVKIGNELLDSMLKYCDDCEPLSILDAGHHYDAEHHDRNSNANAAYKYLRLRYLHFSAKDGIVNSLIYSPSYSDDNAISRIVYIPDGMEYMPSYCYTHLIW